MQTPEKLINFRVYKDGSDLIGVADAQLPSLSAMTETIKGAGIAGEIDAPVLGHFGSMELVLNWRTLEKNNLTLAAAAGIDLDLRGAQQVYDSASSAYKVRPVKCIVRGVTKNTELGKLETGASTETATTIEVVYIKITIDGEDVLELDKYNYIYRVGGTDYLAELREALGLA